MTTQSAPVALVSKIPVDDRTLIVRSAEGDEGAFRSLMERYQGEVFNLALRFLGDVGAAEEVTQDAFIRLFRSLSSFRFEARLSTWLHRVTVNLCRDRWRSSSKGAKEISLDEARKARDFPSARPGPEHEVMAMETQETVQACLLELPEEQREVVLLRYLNGLSYKEISDALDLSAGTVASRLHRALGALSERLALTHEELAHE